MLKQFCHDRNVISKKHNKFWFGNLQVSYPDPISVIFSQTTITDTCWLWNGKIDRGYGRISNGKKTHVVHRFLYETFFGPLRKDQVCCHKCDVRNCINPAHIFIGTMADNLKDMVKKGRSLRGEKNCKAKIKIDDVIKIRNLRKSGRTLQSIGNDFGITKGTVMKICNGKLWKHVKEGISNE